jgi:hypothetical protein
MHKKPFVLMYRSMNGFLCVHLFGERPQSPFTLLYIRANGLWGHSTAVIRIMDLSKQLEISGEEWKAIFPILAAHPHVPVVFERKCRAVWVAVLRVLRSGAQRR